MLGTGLPWLLCCSQYYSFESTASILFVSRVKKIILAFDDSNNNRNDKKMEKGTEKQFQA